MTRVASSGKAPDQLGVRESFAGGVVRGGEDELRGAGTIGERRLKCGGHCERGGDSGDYLEGDLVLAEEGDLFGGAAEDEWVVGGLQADDGISRPCVFEAASERDAGLGRRGCPQRLPTGMMRAVGLARASTSSETRSSGRITSAVLSR